MFCNETIETDGNSEQLISYTKARGSNPAVLYKNSITVWQSEKKNKFFRLFQSLQFSRLFLPNNMPFYERVRFINNLLLLFNLL